MDASIAASVVFTVPSLICPVTVSAPASTLSMSVKDLPSGESPVVFVFRASILPLALSKSDLLALALSALLTSAVFAYSPSAAASALFANLLFTSVASALPFTTVVSSFSASFLAYVSLARALSSLLSFRSLIASLFVAISVLFIAICSP